MPTIESNFDSLISSWRSWGLSEKPRLQEVFSQGKNHDAALIECAGQLYVLKHFRHSAEAAINIQMEMSGIGIAPKVFYHEYELCVMQYIAPAKLDLDALATVLSRLHTSGASSVVEDMDLLAAYDRYLDSACIRVKSKHEELLPLLKEFVDDKTPWCICHNDLVSENCLQDINGRAMLIDWEFAARHNPWFDLASVIVYQDLDRQQVEDFLGQYRAWQSKVEQRIFFTSQIAVRWADLLWHIHEGADDAHTRIPACFKEIDCLLAGL